MFPEVFNVTTTNLLNFSVHLTNTLQKPSKVAIVRITRPLKLFMHVMQHLTRRKSSIWKTFFEFFSLQYEITRRKVITRY